MLIPVLSLGHWSLASRSKCRLKWIVDSPASARPAHVLAVMPSFQAAPVAMRFAPLRNLWCANVVAHWSLGARVASYLRKWSLWHAFHHECAQSCTDCAELRASMACILGSECFEGVFELAGAREHCSVPGWGCERRRSGRLAGGAFVSVRCNRWFQDLWIARVSRSSCKRLGGQPRAYASAAIVPLPVLLITTATARATTTAERGTTCGHASALLTAVDLRVPLGWPLLRMNSRGQRGIGQICVPVPQHLVQFNVA